MIKVIKLLGQSLAELCEAIGPQGQVQRDIEEYLREKACWGDHPALCDRGKGDDVRRIHKPEFVESCAKREALRNLRLDGPCDTMPPCPSCGGPMEHRCEQPPMDWDRAEQVLKDAWWESNHFGRERIQYQNGDRSRGFYDKIMELDR